MQIIDDALPYQLFDRIKHVACHEDTPWYFTSSYQDQFKDESKNILTFHWSHFAYKNDQQVSNLFEPLFAALLIGLDKAGEKFNKLIRIRLGLLNGINHPYQNTPHVDVNERHKAALLYIHNSSAPTQFFKEKYDFTSDLGSYLFFKKILKEKVTPTETVDSIENRMVFFDGSIYHSSNRPTDLSRRVVVNFNYI